MKALLLAGLATLVSLQAQPKVQAFTLPNGLRVLHLEDHEHPLVRANLYLELKPGDVPPDRQGLAQVALRMFEHSSAADLNADDFCRLLDESGIRFTATSAPEGYTWRLVARSRDQDRALGLLADRLLHTSFEPAVLEAQQLAWWREEESLDAPPCQRLRKALAQDPDSRPTLAGHGAITLSDLLTFRARVFRPERAVLVLHGDLGLEQAKRLVILSLGAWTAPSFPKAPAKTPAVPAALPIPAQDPAAKASALLIPGLGFRAEAVAVTPAQLDAETTALLSLLVPGDGAFFPARATMAQGCLVATLDAAPGASAPATWVLLHERIAALRQRGFTQVDLDRARAAWLARRSLDSLDPEAQMDAAWLEAMGRGISPVRLKALSLEALNTALRGWLDPANLRSGAVGEPGALKGLPTP